MLASFMPMFALAATMLTPVNVEIVTPSVSPAEINYGQTLSELTLTGGEVWYKDSSGAKTQIEGYFTIYNASFAPAATDAYSLMLQFVPTDTNYTCPAVFRDAAITTYTGTWPTVKIKAEAVATLVESPDASTIIGGFSLSTSNLSGGKVVDAEGNDITASGTWSWVETPVVTENASYTAKWTATNNDYNPITVDVPVSLAYTVVTKPMLISDKFEFYNGISNFDFEIVPGVIKTPDGTADVPGTYKFTSESKYISLIKTASQISFIPDDENLPVSYFTVNYEIVHGSINFSDETGNNIVPELTMPYGTKLNSDFANTLAKYVNIGENVWIYYRDIDGNEYDYSGTTPGLGTHTYKVTAVPYSSTSNYKATELEFKLTIEPLEVTPSITAYGNDKYMISTDDYTKKPRGTYDLYVDGELAIEDIKYQEEFIWRPEKSGTYNLKAVYNPVENDTYKVNDAVREDFELKLKWEINCTNCTARSYAYGETATVSHMLGDQFAGWVFYDENGKEFTPENMVEYSSYVTFTMPDFSFSVRAKIIGEADDSGNDGNNSGSGNADSTSIFGRFFEYLRSLFEKFINIVKTIFGMFVPVN